jgi:hypothetical protein
MFVEGSLHICHFHTFIGQSSICHFLKSLKFTGTKSMKQQVNSEILALGNC